jgi:VanZ family protein
MTAIKLFLRKRPWVLALVWVAAIMVVSSLPSPAIGPPLFPGCDKIAHFIEYFILGAALSYWGRARADAAARHPYGDGSMLEAAGRPARMSVRDTVVVWSAWLGFAALDEFHQRFIPGREMSFWDFAADAAGLAAGYFIWARVMRGRRQ